MEKKMIDLVNVLARCQSACNYCFNACLGEGDVKMMTQCIKLDKDCGEICGLAISLVSSSSGFVKEILMLCFTACEECAKECRKYPHEHCKECAEACEECAEACRNFV